MDFVFQNIETMKSAKEDMFIMVFINDIKKKGGNDNSYRQHKLEPYFCSSCERLPRELDLCTAEHLLIPVSFEQFIGAMLKRKKYKKMKFKILFASI